MNTELKAETIKELCRIQGLEPTWEVVLADGASETKILVVARTFDESVLKAREYIKTAYHKGERPYVQAVRPYHKILQ